ncbi:hypothetical protein [Candidatus Thiodictyon syntrophicum]|jgi:hypothetical protein|uniref:Uncharacterized protein n=1 Tax=Candidatus Thiodictyon syntrophicum TaxID=1166950 RepID=A0A2K8UAG4_9GAMM|nr:hypothetical protein [Candidatus Thiodictyon syntrophicum]AUB82564.1 hypothetical protein THSYN_17510 [Candidatus Thiodictyon syntrophicum]
MNRSIVRREVVPFLVLFGSLIVATAITDALLHAFGLYWIATARPRKTGMRVGAGTAGTGPPRNPTARVTRSPKSTMISAAAPATAAGGGHSH